MNIVIEFSEQIPLYTDMRATLTAMGVDAKAYDWHVADVETNVAVPLLKDGGVWISGEDLPGECSRAVA